MKTAIFATVMALSALVGGATASSAQEPVPAQQETNCASLETVMDVAENEWGEEPIALFLSPSMGIMQLLADEETGTWTVISTEPLTGLTCIVDAGEGFIRALVKPNV